ncbi:MBL fold metallo-hydrolase [uncultured Roseobacter sp.]|uniref:MBL fold metallo-hydrolase n=1 Tax=uncultured Roseobacter sp. TaxID=114847 RepID=UPI0026290953|nr:MBL fold metallo-hydrolase [uncultured Roseobacter sp.]
MTRALFIIFALLFGCSAEPTALQANPPEIQDVFETLSKGKFVFDGEQQIVITYYGVSTLLIDDGETQIMVDGFFTRPPLSSLALGKIEPDTELLKRVVAKEALDRLAAIVVAHSHHDHALDSAPLAELTGALLIGSSSTLKMGEGWGLEKEKLLFAPDAGACRCGQFKLKMIPSAHFDTGRLGSWFLGIGKQLESPIQFPAGIRDFKEGGSFSIVIEHPSITLLVHASASFIPGALEGVEADVVFLGIGGLGGSDHDYISEYLDEVVEKTRPELVVPIHWDPMTKRPGTATNNPIVDDIRVTAAAMVKYFSDRTTRLKVIIPKNVE